MAESPYIDVSPSPHILQVLDPSPVSETPTSKPRNSTNDSYFPVQRTSTLGLSTSTLTTLQKYSSLTFSLFAALHITNTSLLPLLLGTPASSRYLLLTRPYYQSTLAEPLVVIAPLAIHIASGVALRLSRRATLLRHAGADSRADRKTVPWPRLSVTSALGYAAVPLVLGHASLTRLLPLIVEGGSSSVGLEYVGHGVAIAPVLGFVGFSALVGIVASHMVLGTAHWIGVRGRKEGRRTKGWWGSMVAGVAVVGVWLAGGVGVVCRNGKVGGWVGKGYDELYRRVPLLGMWV